MDACSQRKESCLDSSAVVTRNEKQLVQNLSYEFPARKKWNGRAYHCTVIYTAFGSKDGNKSHVSYRLDDASHPVLF